MQESYLCQTKPKVICISFLRISLVVRLVFEVKSAVTFSSPYIIYDYCFLPSSAITQNLVSKNDVLALVYAPLIPPYRNENGKVFNTGAYEPISKFVDSNIPYFTCIV